MLVPFWFFSACPLLLRRCCSCRLCRLARRGRVASGCRLRAVTRSTRRWCVSAGIVLPVPLAFFRVLSQTHGSVSSLLAGSGHDVFFFQLGSNADTMFRTMLAAVSDVCASVTASCDRLILFFGADCNIGWWSSCRPTCGVFPPRRRRGMETPPSPQPVGWPRRPRRSSPLGRPARE